MINDVPDAVRRQAEQRGKVPSAADMGGDAGFGAAGGGGGGAAGIGGARGGRDDASQKKARMCHNKRAVDRFGVWVRFGLLIRSDCRFGRVVVLAFYLLGLLRELDGQTKNDDYNYRLLPGLGMED